MPDSSHLEPAERDPKKLRRTAWWLIGVMMIGGWLVMRAYEKWTMERSGDDRPSIVHRIQPERSLRVVRQDGSQADLVDLRNNVFAIHVMHSTQPEDSARSLEVLRRVAAAYAEENDFRVVTLVLDPGDATSVVGKLQSVAGELGAVLPQWWVASNEPETLKNFIRKELKPSTPPEVVDGRWVFDPRIVLVDRNGHLRRAVVPQKVGGPPYIAVFDFDQAVEWDAAGKKTGTDLNNQQQLEKLLVDTIDRLLAEPFEDS